MASKPGTIKDFLYIPLSMWLTNETLHRINKPTILIHDFGMYFSCCSFLKNMNWGLLTYNHKFQVFLFLTVLPNSVSYLWKATLSCRASKYLLRPIQAWQRNRKKCTDPEEEEILAVQQWYLHRLRKDLDVTSRK